MKLSANARASIVAAIFFLGSVAVAAPIEAQDTYDAVITNGRVMDPESGLDAVRNVGILAGKIRAISTGSLVGKTKIDAKGLVIAPGFIDLHQHGQDAENDSPHRQRPLRHPWNLKWALPMWTPGMPRAPK